jgi:hypothetical protein
MGLVWAGVAQMSQSSIRPLAIQSPKVFGTTILPLCKPREISAVFPEINHRPKPTNQVVGDFQESYSKSKLCDFHLYHPSRNFRANVEGAASVIFVHKVNCLEEDSLALTLTCQGLDLWITLVDYELGEQLQYRDQILFVNPRHWSM